jgi:hypothetical protein
MDTKTFFGLIDVHKPLFMGEVIQPFRKDWNQVKLFVKDYIWEDSASINVFLVKGTEHPDYIGLTWREFLDKGKRMSLNLPLLESNPGYYYATDKKLPTMSYIQIDGGDYYVADDGNHRTCIAKFFFFFFKKTELNGVTISRYVIDWTLKKLFDDILYIIEDRRLFYKVEPYNKCLSREDTANWMRQKYQTGIYVKDLKKGSETILDEKGAEEFLNRIKNGGFWKKIFG